MSETRTNAGPRKTASTAQMQFREWVGLLISLCIIGVILVSAFDSFSSVLFSHVSSEVSLGPVRPRAGHILVETDLQYCAHILHLITTTEKSFQVAHLASNSFTMPRGRSFQPEQFTDFDAIRKSFLGR